MSCKFIEVCLINCILYVLLKESIEFANHYISIVAKRIFRCMRYIWPTLFSFSYMYTVHCTLYIVKVYIYIYIEFKYIMCIKTLLSTLFRCCLCYCLDFKWLDRRTDFLLGKKKMKSLKKQARIYFAQKNCMDN